MEKFQLLDLRFVKDARRRNALLELFYNSFLVKYFGVNPQQLEPLEKLCDMLDPQTPLFLKTISHVVIALDGDKLIGGCVFELYPRSRCGLLSYFCVDPEYRQYGLGKLFIKKALEQIDIDSQEMDGRKSYCLFLETNNPFIVKADTFNPIARIKALSKMGCELVCFEYIQPPVPGYPPDHNLVLLCVRRERKGANFLRGTVLLRFLWEIWEASNALKNPFFTNTVNSLLNKKIPVRELTPENIAKIELRVTDSNSHPTFKHHPSSHFGGNQLIKTLPLSNSEDNHPNQTNQEKDEGEGAPPTKLPASQIKFFSKL